MKDTRPKGSYVLPVQFKNAAQSRHVAGVELLQGGPERTVCDVLEKNLGLDRMSKRLGITET